MIVCPHCAEDCPDDATTCAACQQAMPAWTTRLPLSTPRESRRLEVFAGYAFVLLAGTALFIEAVFALGLAFFDPTTHR